MKLDFGILSEATKLIQVSQFNTLIIEINHHTTPSFITSNDIRHLKKK